MNTQWMSCTTCTRAVIANETGICLGCQRGFSGVPQEDDGDEAAKTALKKIQEEKRNATKVRRSKKVDACKQASNGKKVGKRDTKGKTPKKGKEKAEKECLKTAPTSLFARLRSFPQSLLKK